MLVNETAVIANPRSTRGRFCRLSDTVPVPQRSEVSTKHHPVCPIVRFRLTRKISRVMTMMQMMIAVWTTAAAAAN
jgi:hypothetical protein